MSEICESRCNESSFTCHFNAPWNYEVMLHAEFQSITSWLIWRLNHYWYPSVHFLLSPTLRQVFINEMAPDRTRLCELCSQDIKPQGWTTHRKACEVIAEKRRRDQLIVDAIRQEKGTSTLCYNVDAEDLLSSNKFGTQFWVRWTASESESANTWTKWKNHQRWPPRRLHTWCWWVNIITWIINTIDIEII